MPQMAPMSWVTLMTFFTLILISILIFNLFLINTPMTQMMKMDSSKSQQSWKW
nr:ATP synthase F0 subunit 8 [Myrmecophilus kubotai]